MRLNIELVEALCGFQRYHPHPGQAGPCHHVFARRGDQARRCEVYSERGHAYVQEPVREGTSHHPVHRQLTPPLSLLK
ncbi:unnamed protein product [Timema podura]|uniref:Uncharacterized protein n=1 Tax=Timema podura TaxID=61482 RepID=A0ABN7NZI9_TIMPD|nr:unnamed protein product [Timema podura]